MGSAGPAARDARIVAQRQIRRERPREVLPGGMEFESPAGDPGWFGPDSATWYVHSHTPALIFGLQCASYLERLDPSIFWMGGMHHSRLVRRREDGTPTMSIDPDGAMARLGHSLAFFMGGPRTDRRTALSDWHERCAPCTTRSRGSARTAPPTTPTTPDWLRWNYATVVWGSRRRTRSTTRAHCAGPNSTGTTGEFVRVGAFARWHRPAGHQGGDPGMSRVVSPASRPHTRQRDGHGRQREESRAGGGGLGDPRHDAPPVGETVDLLCAAESARASGPAFGGLDHHQLGAPVDGGAPEFAAARRPVAGGTDVPHTLPRYELGSDPPELSRAEVEATFSH